MIPPVKTARFQSQIHAWLNQHTADGAFTTRIENTVENIDMYLLLLDQCNQYG